METEVSVKIILLAAMVSMILFALASIGFLFAASTKVIEEKKKELQILAFGPALVLFHPSVLSNEGTKLRKVGIILFLASVFSVISCLTIVSKVSS